MEIFQTIWNVLITPNKRVLTSLIIPFSFIEVTVVMLLFTTILNITSTLKQKIFYVLTFSILSTLLNYFLPDYSVLINMFLLVFLIMKFFKISFFKGIIAEIISFSSVIISESLFLKLYLITFNITPETANNTPIYRILFVLIMYGFIYILYKLAKHFNFNITLLDTIDKKGKILIITSCILGILNVFVQNYVNSYYSNILPIIITILSSFTLLAFFIISLYSITKITKLQLTEQHLHEAQLYNKSLKILHDNVRAFKHDFSNIVQAIGRIYWNK